MYGFLAFWSAQLERLSALVKNLLSDDQIW